MSTFQNYPPSGSGGGAGGAVNISDASGNPLNSNGGGALKVDGSATTQPVSVSGSVPVTGTFWQSTQPVSVASLPLPSGAATDATLAAASAKLPATLGQKVMATSMAVTIASDQTAIPITGSITATNPSVGTTGAAVPASATYLGAFQSGNLTAMKLDASANLFVAVNAALPAGTNVIGKVSIDQTTPGTTNGVQVNAALPAGTNTIGSVKLTDGTNTATIKAASTAPIATDTAQVVAISPNTPALATKAAVNANGSGSAAAATVSTVITLTAPANAVGFILQNLDTSSTNIRWAVGRTATATLGQQLQPGRDTGFIPVGANVSLVSESGTNNYDIQWVSQ